MGYLDNLYASNLQYDDTIVSPPFGAASVQAVLDVLKNKASAASGVSANVAFGYQGSLGTGQYLNQNGVPSNQAGIIVPGSNKIVRLTLSSGQVYNNAVVIQIARRTGTSSFTDIAGASITIPGNNTSYSATVSGLSILIGPDWELSAYLKSGNTVAYPSLQVFVVPQ